MLATVIKDQESNRFSFNVLGSDTPLYNRAQPESAPTSLSSTFSPPWIPPTKTTLRSRAEAGLGARPAKKDGGAASSGPHAYASAISRASACRAASVASPTGAGSSG